MWSTAPLQRPPSNHATHALRQAELGESTAHHCHCESNDAPLSVRLYLPPVWLDDPVRLDRAGVPPEERRDLTKGQIALELLDQARAEGWPGRVVVADSGYGVWRAVSPGASG